MKGGHRLPYRDCFMAPTKNPYTESMSCWLTRYIGQSSEPLRDLYLPQFGSIVYSRTGYLHDMHGNVLQVL